jgi:signal peptidase I
MASASKTQNELRTVRDTVESIWVAIVLAFVLRAFMVEAFVIPTGSMAPRLMGEHYDLVCPACAYEFPFGRARENIGHRSLGSAGEDGGYARCPSCGYPLEAHATDRSGDRVLVLKYLYRIAEPEPWDVVVFKNPQDNAQNYIKRLIGLPGETIEIVHGDIFVKPTPDADWEIRRKPERAQEAVWQIVFDNDYRPDIEEFEARDSHRKPPTWGLAASATGWNLDEDGGRTFRFAGAETPQWLELQEMSRDDFRPHYGYNSPRLEGSPQIDPERDICSDLRLEAVFFPEAEDSQVQMLLTSFDHEFRGEIHADGTVNLWCRQVGETRPVSWGSGRIGSLKLGRGHKIALSHADFRVMLWVDGKAVLTSSEEDYSADHDALAKRIAEVALQPIPQPQVKIAGSGGSCRIGHVRLMRDVFYTCPYLRQDPGWAGPLGEYARSRPETSLEKIGGPIKGWGVTGNPISLADSEDDDLDEFFVLGDNSPQSLDSRAWVLAAPTLRLYADGEDGRLPQYKLGTVPRYNLIGKAFFVYWPAGFNPPGLDRLPIVPNVGRMRLIR